jgi:hypothetical protein
VLGIIGTLMQHADVAAQGGEEGRHLHLYERMIVSVRAERNDATRAAEGELRGSKGGRRCEFTPIPSPMKTWMSYSDLFT